MKIFTDGLYLKGSTHKECQDYINHGTEPLPFCVVSDGCSGAKNSDIGSRILSHALPQVIKLIGEQNIINYPAEDLAIRVHSYALSSIMNLGIDESALHATLLFAIAKPETNELRVTMIGDGILAIKMKESDNPMVLQSDYSKDYPLYPGYLADKTILSEFERISAEEGQKVSHNWLIGSEPDLGSVNPHPYIYDIVLPLDSIEWLMLASDGLDTFVEKEFPHRAQNMTKLVLPLFTAIKKRQGTFASRRINKLVTKELSEFNHEDDLSVAGISIM